jgi:hypothetical protein
MARGKRGKQSRSRRTTSLNLWSLGTSLISAGIVTNGFFNTSPRQFFLSWPALGNLGGISPTGNSGSRITAYELLNWNNLSSAQVGNNTALGQVQANLMKNGVPMVLGLIGVRIGSRVLKRAVQPFLTQTNRMLKAGGIREVRV